MAWSDWYSASSGRYERAVNAVAAREERKADREERAQAARDRRAARIEGLYEALGEGVEQQLGYIFGEEDTSSDWRSLDREKAMGIINQLKDELRERQAREEDIQRLLGVLEEHEIDFNHIPNVNADESRLFNMTIDDYTDLKNALTVLHAAVVPAVAPVHVPVPVYAAPVHAGDSGDDIQPPAGANSRARLFASQASQASQASEASSEEGTEETAEARPQKRVKFS